MSYRAKCLPNIQTGPKVLSRVATAKASQLDTGLQYSLGYNPIQQLMQSTESEDSKFQPGLPECPEGHT